MEQQLVIFELSKELYGVEIGTVEGIIKMQPITVVPHAPAFVEGVTNLRGAVLPVIDLRKRFGLPQQAATKDSRIVVVVMGTLKVGIIVDGVSEVLRVPDEAIEPPSPLVSTMISRLTPVARGPRPEYTAARPSAVTKSNNVSFGPVGA